MKPQLILLAEYNTWINRQLYAVASQLPAEALQENRRAFFGSIAGTFNHLMVGDLIWLRRFAIHPKGFPALAALQDFPSPSRLDEILYPDFQQLREKRTALDKVIEAWVGELQEEDLGMALEYRNTKGVAACKNFLSLLLHFFTHQVHHRGQITTLFSQAGLDFGETDLLLGIPNVTRDQPKIILEGYIEVPEDELDMISSELPVHTALTRQEDGCLVFTVEQDQNNRNRFNVYEEFASQEAFENHQNRVKASRWGHITRNVRRHYSISGV